MVRIRRIPQASAASGSSAEQATTAACTSRTIVIIFVSMGVCLINLMRHFKKYQGIVPENITKPKKTLSKLFPPQKKVFIQNNSSCLNVANSKLAFIVRCACARRSSKQATASAPTEEAATTLTKHDKTKEIPRSHLHSIHFEEEIKQSDAVFSRSRACRAATGGTEEASFTGKCQMYSDASSLRRLCKSLLSQHTYPIS